MVKRRKKRVFVSYSRLESVWAKELKRGTHLVKRTKSRLGNYKVFKIK